MKNIFSFDRPAALLGWFLVISGTLWVVQTSLLQNILPLDVVEAVVWGNELQWGQMKSPPLSGWLAAAFWHLSGGGDWALYLLAQLTEVVGLYFAYKLAREFLNEYESAIATLLLCFLYYYNPPAMKFCSHDTQIALLPAMTLYFVRALRDGKLKDWLLLALFSALAILGKYSAGQVLVAFAIVMLATPTGRKRLLSYPPYLCLAVFLALLAPHIVWVFRHDFLSIEHMGDRLNENGRTWYLPFEHLAILLYPYLSCAGILAIGMFPWRKPERRPVELKPLTVLLPLALIPPGIYLALSLCGQMLVEQWFSYLAYPAGIIIVLLSPYRCGRREFKNLFILLNVATVILLIATTIDVLTKPRFKIHTEPGDIVAAGEAFWREHGGGKPLEVAFGERYLAGIMELYSPSHPAACDNRDICAWELVRERAGRNGMLLISRDKPLTEVKFLPDQPSPELKIGKCEIKFRAKFGKAKKRTVYFTYWPPAK